MSIRLEKPWQLMTRENIYNLPGQLGVYALGAEAADRTDPVRKQTLDMTL